MFIAAALAAEPDLSPVDPRFRFTFDAALGISYWGIGLRGKASPGIKMSLWNQKDSVLFGDTFLQASLDLQATPAYFRAIPTVTFSPVAVLELSAHYAQSYWFGTFSTLKGFDSPDAVYDDAALDAITSHPGTGHRFGGSATLQGKVGPVILVVFGDAERWHTDPDGGRDGCCVYESERELLFRWDETYLDVNDLLVWQVDIDKDKGRLLRFGNYSTYSSALGTGDVLFRAGAVVAYSHDKHWGVIALAQPYIISRVYTTAFPPYVAGQVSWSL